jgi:hypothetical protein
MYHIRIGHFGIVNSIDTACFAYCIPFWPIRWTLKQKERTNETHHIHQSNHIRSRVETVTRTHSKDVDQTPFYHFPKVVRVTCILFQN